MSDEETTAEDEAKTTKKAAREALAAGVKNAILSAGSVGITAPGIAEELGLLTGDAEKDKDVLHEMRAVARNVCKKEGWSRLNRQGRQKLYQAIPEEDAQKQLDAANAAAAEAKEAKKAARKAEREAAAAEDDDEDEDEDEDDE